MYSHLEKYAPKLHNYFEMRKKNTKKMAKSIKNDDFIVKMTRKKEPFVHFFTLLNKQFLKFVSFLFVFLGDKKNYAYFCSRYS